MGTNDDGMAVAFAPGLDGSGGRAGVTVGFSAIEVAEALLDVGAIVAGFCFLEAALILAIVNGFGLKFAWSSRAPMSMSSSEGFTVSEPSPRRGRVATGGVRIVVLLV